MNAFEIPNNQIIKVLKNYFQNISCFSWINMVPVLVHLKYWYYNFPQLEPPCLSHHLRHILL